MTSVNTIFDTSQSNVSFSIKKLGFLNVQGTLTDFHGNISFNEKDIQNSGFEVSMSTLSIKTGNAKRDEHLKSKEFFYVKEFPKISFQSRDIKKVDNQYLTTGQLTILNQTKEISIPFSYQNGMFKGSFSLNRFGYNLGTKFPSFIIGKRVQININAKIN